MKSVVLTSYGDPVRGLEYRELPEPDNDLTIRGFSLGNPAFVEQIPQAIREAARMIAIHEVTVPITAIYPLDEIKSAVAHALQGGKVLLEAGGCP
jgi:NADPH:quinone reductase-like Zn-dependent oxidoreductase